MMCPLFVSTRLIHKESRELLVKFVFFYCNQVFCFLKDKRRVEGSVCETFKNEMVSHVLFHSFFILYSPFCLLYFSKMLILTGSK